VLNVRHRQDCFVRSGLDCELVSVDNGSELRRSTALVYHSDRQALSAARSRRASPLSDTRFTGVGSSLILVRQIPSPLLAFLSPLLSLPFPPYTPFLFLPLEVGHFKYSYGIWGERCKLPQQGLGQSPFGNRIWCILAIKSDVCWHQI